MQFREMLETQEMRRLFLLVNYHRLPHPMHLSQNDTKLLRRAYYAEPQTREQYIDEVLDPYEPAEPEPGEPLDEEDLEMREEIIRFHNRRKHIGELLMEAEKHKKENAEILSRQRLTMEQVQSFLEDLTEEAGEIIDSILAGNLKKDEEGYYPLNIIPDDNHHVRLIEDNGYGVLRRIPWYKAEDEREHITGLLLSDDVTEVFRRAETAAVRSTRRIRTALEMCMCLIDGYYEIAPVRIMMRLYDILHQAEPDRYPALSEEELNELIGRYYGQGSRVDSCVRYQGENYLTNVYECEINDNTTEEESSLVQSINHKRECGYDFYLPTAEEIRGYWKYGYDPGRECFARLRQFVKEVYLDEKTVADMSDSMFSVMLGESASALQHGYSMDNVENNTNEMFTTLTMDLGGNNEAERVMGFHEDFTAPFTDEAKQQLRDILKECEETGPLTWFLGHSLKEVRDQKLENV